MIYHEVAIDPESVEDLKDLGLIEKLFGFEHGRLIAMMPDPQKGRGQKWTSCLVDHLKQLLPGKVVQIEEKVRVIQRGAVIHSRKRTVVGEGVSWLEVAKSVHTDREFQAILCGDSCDEPLPFCKFQDFHTLPETYPDCLKNPVHVTDSPKDPQVFLKHLTPLIGAANRLVFIDPYFNPVSGGKKWKNLVRDLSEYLREAKRTRVGVTFHGKLPEDAVDPSTYANEARQEIESWFPPETDLSFSVWSNESTGQRLHPRYLLTNKGGAGLEYGLDASPDQRTDVALLPLEKVKQTLDEYDPENPTLFRLEKYLTFKGRRGGR